MRTSNQVATSRSGARQRGTDAQTSRGRGSHARNQLKSDKDNMMSAKPATVKDQFGSRHNQDSQKHHQHDLERARGERQRNGQDLALRESAQDTQRNRGSKNKLPGRRSRRSGSPKKSA